MKFFGFAPDSHYLYMHINPYVMKTILHSILVFVLILASCENGNQEPLDFSGKVISRSDCKHNVRSATVTAAIADSITCVEYAFDASTNKLILKHINAAFNCCMDSLYCHASLKSDTIQVEEIENGLPCKCNCLYDLTIELNGVEAKKYYVRFIEPLIGEQTELVFKIDLSKDTVGSYGMTRKQYPWGGY